MVRIATVALSLVALSGRALAQDANARAAAAQAFDEAVAHFDRAEYAEAARIFLRADELAPNADAVGNAIQAARKANDHLLVVTAAERALSLSATGELATLARDALAESGKSLAHLHLACDPAPCTLSLDGTSVPAGSRYVLPGTHVATARAADGNESTEHLSLAAGATYEVVLFATLSSQAPQRATVSSTEAGAKTSEHRDGPPRDVAPPAKKKPLPPAVFYTGVGATVVLAGLWTWSGIDTLNAKADLPKPSTQAKNDEVYGKAHRTTALMAGTLLVGGLTAASAFLWVDFGGDGGATAAIVPVPGGAMGGAQGRF